MICHLYGKQCSPSSSPTRLLSVFVGGVGFSSLTCICACCPSLPSTHALENHCALSFRQVHGYSRSDYFHDDVRNSCSLHSTPRPQELLRVSAFLLASLIEAPLVKHACAGGRRSWRREAPQDHGAAGAVLRRSVVVILVVNFGGGFVLLVRLQHRQHIIST